MMELLIFNYDHSRTNISAEQVAALPKPFDLIAWRHKGWQWGKEELSHEWFRIVQCDLFSEAELNSFLAPLPRSRSGHEFGLYRAFYFDFTPYPDIIDHFTYLRKVPKVQLNRISVNDTESSNLVIKKLRKPIRNPAYIGDPPDIFE